MRSRVGNDRAYLSTLSGPVCPFRASSTYIPCDCLATMHLPVRWKSVCSGNKSDSCSAACCHAPTNSSNRDKPHRNCNSRRRASRQGGCTCAASSTPNQGQAHFRDLHVRPKRPISGAGEIQSWHFDTWGADTWLTGTDS